MRTTTRAALVVAFVLALAQPAAASSGQPTMRARYFGDHSAIVRGSHMGRAAHYIVECSQKFQTDKLKACETHEWAEPRGNFYMPWRTIAGRVGNGWCDIESPCFLVAFAVDDWGHPIRRAIVASTLIVTGNP